MSEKGDCFAEDDPDPLAAARGIIWGVVAGILIWCAIALALLTLAELSL
jgi:hypothetical protein